MSQSLESEVQSQIERWKIDAGSDASWDARRLVNDLSKAGWHDLAIEHGGRALEIWGDFEPLTSALAWALYRRDLADVTEESSLEHRRRAKQAVDRIQNLCSAAPYNNYSPWPSTALKFASVLAKRWPLAALDQLAQLEPLSLSETKSEKFPADRERWHMLITKALEAAQRWEELSHACDIARRQQCIDAKNQKWIRLRQAEAWLHIGRHEEAESIISAEAKTSSDWWLHARWARVLVDLKRTQEALDAAYHALNAGGASSFGWETLALVGELLESSEPALAGDHVRLSKLFREKEGWPVNQPLNELAKRLDINDTEGNIPELLRKLKKIWQKTEDTEREEGTVIKHLNEAAGFIETDSGTGSLFFSLPRESKKQLPKVGSRISFVREKSFDKKKERDSERATKWRPIQLKDR
jgi:hypothetical protein